MRNKILKILVAALLLISPVTTRAVSAEDMDIQATMDSSLEYLKEIIDMVKDKYKGEISDEELIEGALKGIFDTMDPYTTYLSSQQANTFFDSVGGTYQGIGVSMGLTGEYIVVLKVFPASPAEKAGILPGDKLVEVDGSSIVGASAEQAQSMIVGETGTQVTIGVIRDGQSDIIRLDVLRGVIKINPVTFEERDGIGYIRLDTFNSNTYEGIAEALDYMDKQHINKIVLDLRNNPGGLVDQAVYVARRFVPEGLITKLDFQSENDEDIEYYSFLQQPEYKLAVLVNGMTASASEILAGAIQDTCAGTIIGTKTYGKAKVQQTIPLLSPEAFKKYEQQLGVKVVNAYDLIYIYGVVPEDDEIIGWTKVTTGEYFTPSGRMIDQQGLTPDIMVEGDLLIKNVDINSIQKLAVASSLTAGSEAIDVYNAEKILRVLGYSVNEPDVLLDESTLDAIVEFSADYELDKGESLDLEVQKALNAALDEILLKFDLQYAAALDVLRGESQDTKVSQKKAETKKSVTVHIRRNNK